MTPDQLRLEETRQWLDRGRRDLNAAKLLLAGHAYPEALFHCQQAVEKALKAFLAFHQRPFRKTHDLGDLSEMTKYGIILYWSDEDQAFLAEVPELPGCAADGPTRQDALANAIIAEWLETAKEQGRPIPDPKADFCSREARRANLRMAPAQIHLRERTVVTNTATGNAIANFLRNSSHGN